MMRKTLTDSWSSKQRISQEDLVSLQKDLLGLSIRLAKKGYNTPGIMTDTTYADMTRNISTRNMLENILINLGSG